MRVNSTPHRYPLRQLGRTQFRSGLQAQLSPLSYRDTYLFVYEPLLLVLCREVTVRIDMQLEQQQRTG